MTTRPRRTDVTLRALAPDDAPRMLGWMRDPDVAANLGLRAAPTPEKTQAFIERSIRHDDVRAWAIEWSRRHVGNVVLDRFDSWVGSARLSVYIGEPPARGQGVGAAAITLALRDAFGPLGLSKVWLTVHEENVAARRTYRSLGFHDEGVLREEFLLAGRRVNAIYMGILKREFERLAAEGAGR
jgi:RimJ/RimL family protein N-acetyltransferase